ncbi:MAG: ankyrin repeat domain-containing protein [Winogradskyella sp.]|nr:MAG: ankyrin repeat domain-containing protein [Winogradskyella sp.]
MNATELFFDTIRKGLNDRLELQIGNNPEVVNTKDSRGFTPLIFATYFGNETAAKILLDNGVHIDAKDASGNTALLGVSFKGNIVLAETLIKHGADINAGNNTDTTPLIFAAMYNQKDMVDYLLSKGADKFLKDQSGKTALDHAMEKQFNEVANLLK